ncbi:MAG TPA: LysR family transcriptional regulator [Chloroflexota bacterium]|nr:LysR family transcriptional regulator [Chloroflexota bacterium]
MQLDQLRYFLAVARHLSFTRAAEALPLSQPSLTNQIRKLERELGVELFERTTRRVRLTPAGEDFVGAAQQILNLVESAEIEMHEFSGLKRGRVLMGTIPTVGAFSLPPLLADFHRRFQGIELAIQEEGSDVLLQLLLEEALDLAIITAAEAHPSGALERRCLVVDEMIVLLPPTHRLADRQVVSLGELRDEQFVLFKPGYGLRRVVLDACAEAGFSPTIAFESNQRETIYGMVQEGLGIALLPRSGIHRGEYTWRLVPLDPPNVTRELSLAWKATRRQSEAAKAFREFLLAQFE